MKNYWVSWFATYKSGPRELHSPWWISGARFVYDRVIEDDREEPSVVAAVRAESEDAAKAIILAAHDSKPADLEWRFVEERPEGWSPFSGRFPRADWMQWAA